MKMKFEKLEELKAHVAENGMPAFAACPDTEPTTWVFADSKREAVFQALDLAPKLVFDENDPGDPPVWRVEGLEGLEYIEAVPQFACGQMDEAWGKLMNALDDLMPMMPVSVFSDGGDRLDTFLENFA